MVDLVDMAEEFRAQQMQAAIGGVTRCIQCQTNFEAKQKHFK